MYWTAGRGTNPDNEFYWYVRQNYGAFVQSPMFYTNWAAGEPFEEHDDWCMAMSGTGDYKWEAFLCFEEPLCAICEIDS